MSVRHQTLYSCIGCKEDQSFPAEDLRKHEDELWCEYCWEALDKAQESGLEFFQLKPFKCEIREALEVAFMAGQQDCGVDPSHASAQEYANLVLGEVQLILKELTND